ncbi:hypothetical protein DH2020_024182 [Rehmannia glutinosa]|uniref:Hexosyltransferase n=1 Tax=Rehmannia glutinosa TaxID=99300 RepID=A0ABR0WBY5_REHGL
MAPEILNTPLNRAASGLAKAGSLPSRAYVTFLAGNGDYVKGVVGLAKGLRKVNTIYPLVVAVLPDVPAEHRRELVEQGCIVREIEPVYPPENQTQFAMAYYVINYSKLRIWEFVEYSKMIYLDGDIQVYENIDHLFDLPNGFFYAVMDCFCEKTWSHTPQYKIGYCQQSPGRVEWPKEMGPKPPLYFNAGMFVFEPRHIQANPQRVQLGPSHAMAPPGERESRRGEGGALLCGGVQAMAVHRRRTEHGQEDIKMLVKKWWDIYDDDTLDYNPGIAAAAVVPAADEPQLTAALTEAGVVHFIAAPSAA